MVLNAATATQFLPQAHRRPVGLESSFLDLAQISTCPVVSISLPIVEVALQEVSSDARTPNMLSETRSYTTIRPEESCTVIMSWRF